MMARRRVRKVKIGRLFTLLFLVVLIFGLGYMAIDKLGSKKTKTTKVKEISKIEGYDYSLREDATDYYKKLFKKLSKTLDAKEVDMDEYASLVSEMFVCDFFNLSNKSSKNDVGGSQFVYKEYRNDFEKYAMDSIYKSVENNVYGNRKQKLPTVEKVSVKKGENTSFKYAENTDSNAYSFTFSVKYKEDDGYQSSGSLILIHNGKKIEVASMSDKSSN